MSNHHLFVVITIIGLNFATSAQSVPEMDERWIKLNSLIQEEMKTIDQVTSNRGAGLEHRYFELMSEKLALIREKETKLYLKATTQEVQKNGKQSFFKESAEYYKKTLAKGQSIIKNYSSFSQVSHVYYTMALNSRDFGSDKKTESFLLETLRHAKANNPIVHMAKTSMAEYYYNEKQYAQAIKYYRDVLQDKNDEWAPKHHYNLSWCLLKEKDFSGALKHLHTAFDLGPAKAKVNVRDQVLEAVPLFHVLGNDIERGKSFLLKYAATPVPLLMKLAKQASDKGHFTESLSVIQATKSHIKSGMENDANPALEIILTEMDIYRSFKKEDLFFQASKNAADLISFKSNTPLKIELLDEAIEKIRAEVGFKQLLLTQNAKKRVVLDNEHGLKRVIDFFDIISILRPSLKAQNEYFKGETYFSSSRFLQALKSYHLGDQVSGNIADDKERDEWRHKIIKAMLGTLSESELNKKETDFYTEYAFVKHLEYWPISDSSREIYPRLVNLLRSKKDIKRSEDYLHLYHRHYPQDLLKQQDLLTSLIDDSIARKDVEWLNGWIEKLTQGAFKFDLQKIDKLVAILGDLLYEKILALETKGQWDKAFTEHEALYAQKKYPAIVRGRSALNAAVLATKKLDSEQAQLWWHRSFELLDDKTFLERSPLHLGIITTYPNLSVKYIERFCKRKAPHFDEIVSANTYDLLSHGKRLETAKNIRRFKECINHDAKILQLSEELSLQAHLFNDKLLLLDLIKRPIIADEKLGRKNHEYLKELLHDDFWGAQDSDKNSVLKKLQSDYPADITAKLVGDYKQFQTWLASVALWKKSAMLPAHTPFDPARYNQVLNQILAQYQSLLDKGNELTKTLDPEIYVLIHQEFEICWNHIAQIVADYTPQGIDDKEFVQSFKKQMKDLSKTFNTKAQEHNHITLQAIDKSRALLHTSQQRFPASGHTYFSPQTKLEQTPYGLSFDRMSGAKE